MLEEKVLKTIKKYNLINSQDKIVIGVSGGPDSMCLLHLLNGLKNKLNFEIVVAHINHMLRQEAESETQYVQNFCKRIAVPCFVKYEDIEKLAKKQRIGTEEAGRNVRYQFFEEVAQKNGCNKIATAHNANDNAETILMNLLRGTSSSGLKGIEIIRDGSFIRPIRECSRNEIEEYCVQNNLEPKIDKTNFENIYKRNKIRNELIPYLQKDFNPNIIEGLNRLSNLVSKEEEYFNNLVKNEYNNVEIVGEEKQRLIKEFDTNNNLLSSENLAIVLKLKEFNQLPEIIRARIIMYTIEKVAGSTQGIEKINIEDILKLCERNIGNKYLEPNKRIRVYVKKGKVFFVAISIVK